MLRDPRHEDLPGGELDEEQHVERAEGDRLDGEEVTCQDAGCLGTQELPPVRVRPPGGWPETRTPEDRPDRGGPDPGPQLSKARPGYGCIPTAGSPTPAGGSRRGPPGRSGAGPACLSSGRSTSSSPGPGANGGASGAARRTGSTDP